MWLLNAPFDTKDEAGAENKSKLLKAGVSYTLTRAENHPPPCLRVNSKSVSKDHARIQVVKHSEDDVTRLDVVPVLKITNKRDTKPITVRRGGEDLLLQPLTDMALKSGDFVVLGRKGITATWQPVVLFWKPSGKELSPATKICASIGMKLSLTFAPVITHHVTATMELSDAHVASLLAGAAPVTKAWIDRVFELAQLPIDGLEDTFLLPDPADYAPPFPATSAAAPWTQQTLWRVGDNGEREELFTGIRFLIVSDGPPSPMFCENISRCGGGYDVLDVRDVGADSAAKWDKAIAASKKRAGTAKAGLHSALVVVLDEEDIKPAVTRAWGPLVASLNSAGLTYVASDAVRLAILDRKLKDLDCAYEPAEPENEYVAGTLSDEPSQLAPASQAPVAAAPLPRQRAARKRGTTPAATQVVEDEPAPEPPRRTARRTRASSVAPEPEPEPSVPAAAPVTKRRTRATSAAPEPPAPEPEPAAEEEDIFAPPKRLLRARRTRLASLEIDADGDTSVASVPSQATQPEPETQSLRPPSRLKRRAGGFSLKIGDDDDDDSSIPASTGEEPPLKKFKALFDGTEEGWSSKENESFVDLLESSQSQSQSQSRAKTQTQQARGQKTQSGLGKSQASGLTAVMEVDEDVSEVSRGLPLTNTTMASSSSSSSVATKRKRGTEDVDVEMADAPPTAKRRATGKENANSAQEESQASSSLNAAAGTSKKEKGKTGAVGGVLSAPDKNEKVLTALASLKRGKRTEDAFDREFNALRISRPESDGERRAREEDELFAHFDFDENLRGKKCFEVREYVLPERSERRGAAAAQGSRVAGRGPLGVVKPEWERAPDFKKFKKVVAGGDTHRRREQLNSSPSGKAKIELVCPEHKDFGIGSAYWSHPGGSQSQSQSQADESFAPTQPGSRAKTFMPDFGASDSDEPAPKPKARAGRSQATQSPKKASQAATKKTPLFIADDDDDENDAMIVDDDAPSTLAATLTQGRGARSTAASSRTRKPVLEDSDSDDGMTFKSFRKKASTRR